MTDRQRRIKKTKEVKQTDALLLRYLRMRDSKCCICGSVLEGRMSKPIYIKDKTNLNVRYDDRFCALMCRRCYRYSQEIKDMFGCLPVTKNKFLKPDEKEPEFLSLNDVDGHWFLMKRHAIKKKITDTALWFVWIAERRHLTEIEKIELLSDRGLL